MRTSLALIGLVWLMSVAACTEPPEDGPRDAGMRAVPLRQQLAEPMRLAVVGEESAGTVEAARWLHGMWDGGLVDLVIESGAVDVRAERDGRLELRELSLELAPIEIPEELIGQPASFVQVRAALHAPLHAETTWVGDQLVRGTAEVELDIMWSLAFAGTTLPIGAPDLPAVPATLELTGGPGGVHAALHLHATGSIWDWAGLLRLGDLDLVIGASS